MKNIKRVSALLFTMCVLCVGISAQVVNAKVGYRNVKWGSTIEATKKAGYQLEKIPVTNDFYSMYSTSEVELYAVSGNKEKDVAFVVFVYVNNKLIGVSESLNTSSPWNSSRLQKRYGKLIDLGGGTAFADVLSSEGSFEKTKVLINKEGSTVITNIFAEGAFIKYTKVGQKLSGQMPTSIVDNLDEIAKKLLQEGKGGKKPSYAFLTLTTDDHNSLVETYVTDALTEAVFNTNAIRIVERAKLEKVLKEQKFQNGGLVNEASAKEIGNLTGADYVCYGTIKDLGKQISINARVVDVQSGELCAMGRTSVNKDDYLAGVGYEAAGNANAGAANAGAANQKGGANAVGGNANAKKPVAKVANNLWKVRKQRNDFDGNTLYFFYLEGSRPGFELRIFYYKYDNPVQSRIYFGYRGWETYYENTYEVKLDSGDIKTSKLYNRDWQYAKISGTEYSLLSGKDGSCRFIADMFKNNDYLTIRSREVAVKFQTAGLEAKLAECGIDWDEIENALSNNEF